ncbi:MAG: hypothetical protein AD073_000045 [Mycoplasmataceae bacterium]|nr:MAG: hypothetical protein AD073_000045 [Mycoplasmataceae bacterium]
MEQKKVREKGWNFVNNSVLLLSTSLFFTSYLPSIIKYNINTLFTEKKRGYFDILFTKFSLGKLEEKIVEGVKTENNNKLKFNWIYKFSTLMFVVYFLDLLANVFSQFYKERAKKDLENEITKDFSQFDSVNENQWIGEFSSNMINKFSVLFFIVCDLIVEFWSTIRLNMTRDIKPKTWINSFACLSLIFLISFISKKIVSNISNNVYFNDKNNILFHFKNELNRSRFLNQNTLFFIVYFLLISRSYSFAETELINIILLAGNIQILINKSRKFMSSIPEIESTFNLWEKVRRFSF